VSGEETSLHPMLRLGRSGALRGVCRVPGDKSISHRALLFPPCAMAPSRSADWVRAATTPRPRAPFVRWAFPFAWKGHRPACRAWGCPACARLALHWIVATRHHHALVLRPSRRPTVCHHADWRSSLSRRPMGRVAKPCARWAHASRGTRSRAAGGILPPLVITGGSLRGIDYTLPVASAQLKSALVLAGLQAKGKTCIEEPGFRATTPSACCVSLARR